MNPFKGHTAQLIGIIVPHLVGADWGSNRICRFVTGQGLPFRRQSLLDFIRENRFAKVNEDAISRLPRGARTPRELMTETELLRPRNYRIYGKAVYENELTGELREEWVSVYSNEDLSEEDFFTAVVDAHNEYDVGRDFMIRSVVKRRVDHFRGRPY